MGPKAHVFIGIVTAAAIVLAANLPAPTSIPAIGDLAGLASFIAVGILAEAMAIDFRLGAGRQAKSSLAFLPFLGCVLLFDPFVAVLAVSFVIGVSQFGLRRHDLWRGLFNVSQGALSAGFASAVYSLFVGPTREGISLIGFVLLAAAFFSTNIFLNSVAIALIREHPVLVVLRQVAGARGANLWYDLLASPIAVVPAALYDQYHVGGLIIIVLPLLLIRYSYLSKVQLEEANRDLLKVLVKAIETRDPYTSGHSLRVATLARAIAEDLELTPKQIERVETAALLHDIGKIDVVYEAVIRKPHSLTSAERDLIKTHATKGADLLESLTSVNREVIAAVRHHHERYDGTGYPAGLRADQVPVAARIIMMCDSIDAMLSDRPYRKALSIERTRAELVRCSGSQFDPNIVRVVLQRNTLERAARLVQDAHPFPVEPVALSSTA